MSDPSGGAATHIDGIGHGSVEANGIEFAYLTAGPPEGPLALCFHGFPDTAWTWRHLLGELGKAGLRAVAPFMRAYAPTALPADGRTPMGVLVSDVLALHDALGGGSDAVVVGHDWGAPATYGAAAFAPDRFRRVVGGAVPPTSAFIQALFTYPQLKKSWYFFFFQSPLAEGVVAADGLGFLDRLWADWSPGYDAACFDLPRVKQAIGSTERLAAAIGYYRSMFDPSLDVPELAAQGAAALMPVPQPTLYYHGADDGCVGIEAIDRDLVLANLGPGSELLVVEGAGHFAHLERPEQINRRIVEWLTS
jgi:pimeloyl-ACP methyl ester carboxylesterase